MLLENWVFNVGLITVPNKLLLVLLLLLLLLLLICSDDGCDSDMGAAVLTGLCIFN